MIRISSFAWWTISLTSVLALSACGDDDSSDNTNTGGQGGAKSGKGGAASIAGTTGDAGAGGIPNPGSGGTTTSGGKSGDLGGTAGIGGDFNEGGADTSGGVTGSGGVGVSNGGGAGGSSGGNANKGGTGGIAGGAGKGGTVGSGGVATNGGTAGKGGTTSAGGTSAGGVSGNAGATNGGTSGSAGAAGKGGTAGGGGVGGTSGGSVGTGGTAGTAGTAGTGGGGGSTNGWVKAGTVAFLPSAAAIDPRDDSIWLAGRFKGSVKLSDTVTYTSASAGSWVVARYNATTGALMGSFQTMNNASTVEGASSPTPSSLIVDDAGNVFLAGTGLIGDTTLPMSSSTRTVSWSNNASGHADAVVVKLDASGYYSWGFSFAASAADDSFPIYLGLGGGNLALAFRLSVPSLDKTKLGVGTTGTGTFSQANADSEQSFVLAGAFSASTGAYKWASRFGTSGAADQRPLCVAADSNGDVLLAGQFDKGINFAPSDATKALSVVVGGDRVTDMFAAKLAASNGAHQWSHSFSADDTSIDYSSTDVIGGCAVARGGTTLALWGYFDGEKLGVGATDVSNPGGIGSLAMFFAKLDSTGATTAARPFKSVTSASLAANGDYLIASTVGDAGYNFGNGNLTGTVLADYSNANALGYAQTVWPSTINVQRSWTWFGTGAEYAVAITYDPLLSATSTALYRRVP
ncbi:MAG: hypothetical protein ACOY0T_20795 [Myxococcota bacterium]